MTANPLATFYRGWETYQDHLVQVIAPLTTAQLDLRAAPNLRSIGTVAGHIVATRVWWFHSIMGEGREDLRAMLDWDEYDPVHQSAAELASGLEISWRLIADCLDRWTPADLDHSFQSLDKQEEFSRQWIIWHVIEHDLHHGGEISYSLGMHGLAAINL